MTTPHRFVLSLMTFALPLGCVAPWSMLETCPEEGCVEATETDGSEQVTAGVTITATSPTAGDGSDDTSTTSTTGSDTTATSAGPADAPPSLSDPKIAPSPILFNGPLTVEVKADATEGVRLELDDGQAIELTETDDSIFTGEIAVYTGLDNGEHSATLIPWRGDIEGEAVAAEYTIELPKPGSEALFEAGAVIGEGFVAGLGVLPGGDVIELGTRYIGDEPRCYLRRRDKAGAWFDADVLALLGGDTCAALDLKVADDGRVYLLLVRYDNNVPRWWLGELAGWGAPAKNLRLGDPGDEAAALAIGADMVAVCGATATGAADGKDAAAWIYRPGLPGSAAAFDYTPGVAEPHQFAETIRDCVFAGDVLVMVGEVYGYHEKAQKRDRQLVHRYDVAAETDAWTVATQEVAAQSGAMAVAIDDQGRVLTAGYYCGDDCTPHGLLEVHEQEGPIWYGDLGAWPSPAFGPHDLVWSPAGYVILAAGGTVGDESAFSVRAYEPLNVTPLWSYSRVDADVLHMALTLALGPYGEVYAGGFGAGGYPAVAFIGG